MKKVALPLLVLSACCFAEGPQFDVVSVKELSVNGGSSRGGPGTADPRRFTFSGPLNDLIRIAYGVTLNQIITPAGAHLLQLRSRIGFEVVATMPRSTTKEQFQIMLQNMLADRFHLVMHHESRNFPGYAVTVDKNGPKFHEADQSAEIPALPTSESGSTGRAPELQLRLRNQPIGAFIQGQLKALVTSALRMGDTSALPPQLVDQTGLSGLYSFSVPFRYVSLGDAASDPGSEFPNVVETVQRELGLKIVKVKDVPLDMIVVDRVDPHPSAN